MGFQDISLKISYDSGLDDVLWDFYIPVLSYAKTYDRIAGFFSSSALALAARGIEEFILNGGTMRLVTCPQLSKKDADIIKRSVSDLDSILAENFVTDYASITSAFQRDHVQALGWMLANGKLEIKIAIITKNGEICTEQQIEESGIMHQKVGIMEDRDGNILSFSGSNNESASGWLGNTEEFKVFGSWMGGMPYINEDIKKFKSFWYGGRPDVEIKDLPSAVKEDIIRISSDFDIKTFGKKYYRRGEKKQELKLFNYQEEAVEKWNSSNRQLLLQMATGTGKTRTAIGCMNKALMDTRKLLVVISTPQSTLSSQWKDDIDDLNLVDHREIEINGDVRGWETLLKKETSKLSAGRYKNLVVFTTHSLCHTDTFTRTIKRCTAVKFLIGDEVHGMGAPEARNALLECYKFRLGLSATPERWFDDSGSRLIEEYFGSDKYEFSLHRALTDYNELTGKHFLVDYMYSPHFISLTEAEIEHYKEITQKIVRLAGRHDDEYLEYLENLRFKRADIEKNAENKYQELESILDTLDRVEDTIIFVSDEQIDRVLSILGRRGIKATRFTQKQGTVPLDKYNGRTERQFIIDQFKQQRYQVLVAIKCLDEGIDIPSAARAIVMASSTNPREYVQRIGRIIRQAPGKEEATIHDLIIKPSLDQFYDETLIEMERRIFKKEMDRVLDLSENAINNTTIINKVYRILEEIVND